MATTYPVQLTQLECLYISDTLSMFTQGPPDELPSQGSPYPNLLLKIGSAVLETEQQKAPVELQFSLNELWVIREIAKSSVVVGGERVGLNLLLKIYRGIRALIAESDVQAVVNDLGEVLDYEPGKIEYAIQLANIKDNEYQDSSGNGGSDDGSEIIGGNYESNDSNESRPDNDAASPA
jgi:hypothetical protein